MGVTKFPFNQNLYLGKDDPGACNALVLEWLYNRGKPLQRLKWTMKRAVAVHNRNVASETFIDYGLVIVNADIFDAKSLAQIEECINTIKSWKGKKLFIGFSNPANKTGHAIGLISQGTGSLGFDPNNGYYTIKYQVGDELDEYLWLKKKMLGARMKHSYTEFLIYGCL